MSKNLIKNFNKSEEQTQKVVIGASFEGDDEKAQYASLTHLHLMVAVA